MEFNKAQSTIMLMDINSCFATIEQQANPLLRGKPIVVAAFVTGKGAILAASVEAKRLGIKTGMRVMDAKNIYPRVVVLPPDPWKYRNVHLLLKNIIASYTNDFAPKSIDEFVLNLKDFLSASPCPCKASPCRHKMLHIALEIKKRIKEEVGDWITVSIGIAPNRYLAKIGAGITKPDGLNEINFDNFLDVYSKLKLTDLTGIKEANARRLNSVGIYTVLDFYNAPIWKIKAVFHSITGYYWHIRLSGYEVDDVEYERRSFGNSVAIGKSLYKVSELSPILARLTEKMCGRLRESGYTAGGIHLGLAYKSGEYWHEGHSLGRQCFDSKDFYRAAVRLLINASPVSPVLNVAVSCFGLSRETSLQLEFFEDVGKKENLTNAIDDVNKRWGEFTVSSARSLGGAKVVMDRIAFGGVKELVTPPSPLL